MKQIQRRKIFQFCFSFLEEGKVNKSHFLEAVTVRPNKEREREKSHQEVIKEKRS